MATKTKLKLKLNHGQPQVMLVRAIKVGSNRTHLPEGLSKGKPFP